MLNKSTCRFLSSDWFQLTEKKNDPFDAVHKYSWLHRHTCNNCTAWTIEVSHQWYFCVEFCLEIQHGKQESPHEVKGKKGETAFKGKVQQIKLAVVTRAPAFSKYLSENSHKE